jgi:hypothetical protein
MVPAPVPHGTQSTIRRSHMRRQMSDHEFHGGHLARAPAPATPGVDRPRGTHRGAPCLQPRGTARLRHRLRHGPRGGDHAGRRHVSVRRRARRPRECGRGAPQAVVRWPVEPRNFLPTYKTAFPAWRVERRLASDPKFARPSRCRPVDREQTRRADLRRRDT